MILRAAAAVLCLSPGLAGASGADPFPFDVGGPFSLIDHDGHARTEADPDGQLQLLFFGYANCLEICSAALPLMADTADILVEDGIPVRPVMITVDPVRDTPNEMRRILHEIHPDFVGLTGTDAALAAAYEAYDVEIEYLFTDPAGGDVFAHGSFLYLLDGSGEVLTLLPPILSATETAGIVAKYHKVR